MNKILSIIFALVCMVGCKKVDGALQPVSYSTEYCNNEVKEPLFRTKREVINIHDSLLSYTVKVDLPISGVTAVRDSVTRYILQFDGESNKIDIRHPKESIMAIGRTYSDNAKSDRDLCDDADEFRFHSHSIDWKILLKNNTPTYITYYFTAYVYTGGAHGMPYDYYLSWDAHTGKCLTWEDLFQPGSENDIINLIKHAVLNSPNYRECEESDFWEFQRPANPPALSPKGIIFHYAAYEVCCYAMGLPECTLSYEVIAPYLTSYGKSLVKAYLR